MRTRFWGIVILAVAVISVPGCKKKEAAEDQPDTTPEAAQEVIHNRQIGVHLHHVVIYPLEILVMDPGPVVELLAKALDLGLQGFRAVRDELTQRVLLKRFTWEGVGACPERHVLVRGNQGIERVCMGRRRAVA